VPHGSRKTKILNRATLTGGFFIGESAKEKP
jgi:hypothetical protein